MISYSKFFDRTQTTLKNRFQIELLDEDWDAIEGDLRNKLEKLLSKTIKQSPALLAQELKAFRYSSNDNFWKLESWLIQLFKNKFDQFPGTQIIEIESSM
ncbi:MAG: hypothetical protein ACXAC7_07260 [Candidatus Hodarchaeales archaeon]|jgi:hypothetical protein